MSGAIIGSRRELRHLSLPMKSPPMDFQLVACKQVAPCLGHGELDSQRESRVNALLQEASTRLTLAGFWSPPSVPILIVLDAPLEQPLLALRVNDAALAGLPAHAGRQALLLLNEDVEQDIDILLHELSHVWLRSKSPDMQEPRWQWQEGRASHDGALIHEALADFVAASLTQDPRIGEHSLALWQTRSLDKPRICPDALTGAAHSDSLLISHPLWELSGRGLDPVASRQVMRVLSELPPNATQSIQNFVDIFSTTLNNKASNLSEHWRTLTENSQLHRCSEPLLLTDMPRIAHEFDFIAPGLSHFPGQTAPRSPIHFRAELHGKRSFTLKLHSDQRSPPLLVHWQALEQHQGVLAQGTQPLKGWPSQFLALNVPEGSQRLLVSIVNESAHDARFNNISLHARTTAAPKTAPGPEAKQFYAWPWLLPAAALLLLALLATTKCTARSHRQE